MSHARCHKEGVAQKGKWKYVKDARKAYIRRLLARGKYDYEILDMCEASPLFWYEVGDKKTVKGKARKKVCKGKPKKGRSLNRTKVMARGTIKRYLTKVKSDLRVSLPSAKEELQNAYYRLLEAFRMSVEANDSRAMVYAQKAINRMLGLRREGMPEDLDIDKLREQLMEIYDSVG